MLRHLRWVHQIFELNCAVDEPLCRNVLAQPLDPVECVHLVLLMAAGYGLDEPTVLLRPWLDGLLRCGHYLTVNNYFCYVPHAGRLTNSNQTNIYSCIVSTETHDAS